MNKKGFTIVELLVSITILSVVIVFMSSFIVDLKNSIVNNNIDVNFMIARASISKTINYDAAVYGIEDITCPINTKCNITFENGSVKTVEIVNDGHGIKYYDNDKIYLVRNVKNKIFDILINREPLELEYGVFNRLKIAVCNDDENETPLYDQYIEIYGYWHLETELTVNTDGGVYTGDTPIKLNPGETITINNPTKANSTFDGWDYDATTGIIVSVSGASTSITMGSYSTAITAKWQNS